MSRSDHPQLALRADGCTACKTRLSYGARSPAASRWLLRPALRLASKSRHHDSSWRVQQQVRMSPPPSTWTPASLIQTHKHQHLRPWRLRPLRLRPSCLQTRTPRHSHSKTLALRHTRTPRHSHSETLALRDTLTQTPDQDALQSFNTVMSLQSLNLGLSWSSHPHMLKVSHPAMQSLLKVNITTH